MPVKYVAIPREVEVYFIDHSGNENDQGLPFIENLPESLLRYFEYNECIKEWTYSTDVEACRFRMNVLCYDCIAYEPITGWHMLASKEDLNDFFTRKV